MAARGLFVSLVFASYLTSTLAVRPDPVSGPAFPSKVEEPKASASAVEVKSDKADTLGATNIIEISSFCCLTSWVLTEGGPTFHHKTTGNSASDCLLVVLPRDPAAMVSVEGAEIDKDCKLQFERSHEYANGRARQVAEDVDMQTAANDKALASLSKQLATLQTKKTKAEEAAQKAFERAQKKFGRERAAADEKLKTANAALGTAQTATGDASSSLDTKNSEIAALTVDNNALGVIKTETEGRLKTDEGRTDFNHAIDDAKAKVEAAQNKLKNELSGKGDMWSSGHQGALKDASSAETAAQKAVEDAKAELAGLSTPSKDTSEITNVETEIDAKQKEIDKEKATNVAAIQDINNEPKTTPTSPAANTSTAWEKCSESTSVAKDCCVIVKGIEGPNGQKIGSYAIDVPGGTKFDSWDLLGKNAITYKAAKGMFSTCSHYYEQCDLCKAKLCGKGACNADGR